MYIEKNDGTMQIPSGYSIRRVRKDDYEEFTKTLEVLTTVGEVSDEKFCATVEFWNSATLGASQTLQYHPYVIVDAQDKVAATGTALIEQKVIHNCGRVGHIEDIAVGKHHQGKQLGKYLIYHLTQVCLREKCYKTILDCADKNVGFYEKCQYQRAGVEMEQRATHRED